MKRSTKSTSATWRNILLVVAFTIILIIVLDPKNRPAAIPVPPSILVTQMGQQTATIRPGAAPPSAIAPTVSAVQATAAPANTLPPLATNKPLATDSATNLDITPMAGQLYDVLRSAGALRCPDTRCKVLGTLDKDSIIVVTGSVNGTTYKSNKSKVWFQVVFHDGTKVYVHSSLIAPHTPDSRLRSATASPTAAAG